MDVVDKILFASGEAKVKKEGLEVLKRVVDILKNIKDKNIRIEGHTDNVQITSHSGQNLSDQLGTLRRACTERYKIFAGTGH